MQIFPFSRFRLFGDHINDATAIHLQTVGHTPSTSGKLILDPAQTGAMPAQNDRWTFRWFGDSDK